MTTDNIIVWTNHSFMNVKFLFLFDLGKDLTVKSVIQFLAHHDFPAGCADQLGEQLDKVTHGQIVTFTRQYNYDWSMILPALIDHWLNNQLHLDSSAVLLI